MTRGEAKSFLEKHQVKFDIIRQDTDDPEEMMSQITKDWNGVIPATFVYDKQGNLAYSHFGIIDRDPESYRAVKPDWRPTLPAARPGSFTVTDLLTAAESTLTEQAAGPAT